MGWLIAIVLLGIIIFFNTGIEPNTVLIASVLFAIAGSISFARPKDNNKDNKNT